MHLPASQKAVDVAAPYMVALTGSDLSWKGAEKTVKNSFKALLSLKHREPWRAGTASAPLCIVVEPVLMSLPITPRSSLSLPSVMRPKFTACLTVCVEWARMMVNEYLKMAKFAHKYI